jgi:rubrerythrin
MTPFEFAMQMEKEGEAYYREIGRKVNEKGLKNILSMLADDEAKHYDIIKKMAGDLKPIMEPSDILSRAKNVFRQMKEENGGFISGNDQTSLYRKAQEIEKRSIDFYSGMASEVKGETEREMMRRLADEEKRHYFLLENIIQFVSRPKIWIENAEFVHLDEY